MPDYPVITDSSNYEAIPAGGAATLGTSGGNGDYLAGLLVVPTSVSPGTITISDGGGAAITVFAGTTNALSNLVPFFIPLGIHSKVGPWSLIVGLGMSVVAVGLFT